MIRKAQKRDLEAVNKLLLQVLMVHYEIRPDLYIPNTKKYTDDELLKIFECESTPVFVYDDGGVKGYAFCKLLDYSGFCNLVPIKSLDIDDLCVDESCRGEHIGTKLFEYVKAYAKELGCHSVTLNVWEGNESAKAFYDRMGFGVQRTTREIILD